MVSMTYIPKALKNKPQLWLKNRPIMDAFAFLTGKRPQHFSGIGAIPLLEIIAYCEIAQITGHDREEFIFMLSTMDDFYVRKVNEKQQAAQNGR